MADSTPPAKWRRGSDRTLLHTRIFDVRASDFQHPARPAPREFIIIDPPDWAVVLVLTPARELVLVSQFRFGAEALSLELPGGVIEKGESPLVAAARETAEETGFRGADPVLLGAVHPNPAIQSNRAHVVLISNATAVEDTNWDADEELGLQLLPVDEVLRRARGGEITHALMLNALFLLEGWLKENPVPDAL